MASVEICKVSAVIVHKRNDENFTRMGTEKTESKPPEDSTSKTVNI